ncbi:MAG: DUF401 family protein [Deltaproteobacteria bacterium]|nr:DUF401 family protein [Deltaproteobacteria bacterium]
MLILALVFALILVLMRWVSLGSALMAGAVVLGLAAGLSPFELVSAMALALVAPDTLLISAVVFLIMVLSHFMEKSGHMARLLTAFRGISRNAKANLILFPVLIGLLPMPGGAVFSAPLVEATARQQNLTEPDKALVNYWFRHIWEFSWPLYPGILLASKLSGISLARLAPAMLPLTIIALLAGYRVLLPGVSGSVEEGENAGKGGWKPFLWEFLPIAVVIAGFAVLEIAARALSGAFPALGRLPSEVPLVMALAASIAWTAVADRVGRELFKEVFTQKALWVMVYMIVAIMVFSAVLEKSGTVASISADLVRYRVPVALAAIILPFIVGLVTGITVAFVGTAFPVVLGLAAASGPGANLLPLVALAFCAGYTGVLITPVHACLALTLAYFHSGFSSVWRKLFALCATVFTAGLVLSLLYYLLLRL